VLSLTELARQSIAEERYAEAVEFLEQALVLARVARRREMAGIQENNIHYWLGQAHRLLGQEDAARGWFERASHGLAQPCSAQYYNDQPPEMIFYQGLAHRALDRESEAVRRFETLIGYGQAHLKDDVVIDFFAVSLPDFLVFDADLAGKNELHCRYMTALGYLGLQKEAWQIANSRIYCNSTATIWAHLRIATFAARTSARQRSRPSRSVPFQFEFVPRRHECLTLFGFRTPPC